MNPEVTEPAAKPSRLREFLGSVKRILLLLIIPVVGFVLVIATHTPYGTVVRRAKTAQAQKMNQELCAALKAHHDEYGNVALPDQIAIGRTLSGDNPRGIVFMNLNSRLISRTGQVLDPWGTPYKIDVSNPKNPKVYSFGPNKRDDGGTGDDVVSWR